jgi:hypothetical protein
MSPRDILDSSKIIALIIPLTYTISMTYIQSSQHVYNVANSALEFCVP